MSEINWKHVPMGVIVCLIPLFGLVFLLGTVSQALWANYHLFPQRCSWCKTPIGMDRDAFLNHTESRHPADFLSYRYSQGEVTFDEVLVEVEVILLAEAA